MHPILGVTKGAASVLVLLLTGLLMAGCGSSGSSSSTETTTSISKAEFVAKGNAICIAGEKAQNAAFEAFAKAHGLNNKEPTKAQMTEIVENVAGPNIQHQISAVKALGAPSGEEQQVEEALETSQQALEKLEANPELLFAKQSPFHEAGQQLHAVGLTQCAKHT
jgi:hypothetical protein